MRTEQNPELAKAVQRIVKLNAESKDIGFRIGEIADAAYEAGHVRVPNKAAARKVLKRLAKDAVMDEVEREAQRLIEESIDECRAALGLLADLPLGQVAAEAHAAGGNGHGPGHRGGNGEAKRGRGRPPGSKNKPKAPPPPAPDAFDAAPPDIPDSWH